MTNCTILVVVAERVGDSKSRGLRSREGASPLAPTLRAGHPVKGAHPLQNPRSTPTLSFTASECGCGSALHRTAFDVMAERVGDSKSRGVRAPARGPGPLAPPLRAGHPVKGAHPLQNPRSNPTLSHTASGCGCGSALHRTAFVVDGGEGGIRTHGPLPVNGFRDRPIRPLSHLSVCR